MSDVTGSTTGDLLARRREAGAFLRSRRARITPSDVGLPTGLRRRTPGLRREELAMLAGVGTTWYSWLEQGRRGVQPSADVVAALADALRLDAAERHHLFSLYDRPTPSTRPPGHGERVDEPLRRMVDGLIGQPAFVLGWCWDILMWNSAAEAIVGPYPASIGGRMPNAIEMLFADPSQRALFVDWETVARGALATFRADCTPHTGDPDLECMIGRLTTISREFAAWWPQHDIADNLSGTKRLDHPTAGRMHFTFSMLAVGDQPGIKLLVLTADDDEDTPGKLSRLLERAV